jgi:hypothetical protein
MDRCVGAALAHVKSCGWLKRERQCSPSERLKLSSLPAVDPACAAMMCSPVFVAGYEVSSRGLPAAFASCRDMS